MTIDEAIQILDERNRAGRILNRRTGEHGSISAGARAGLISSMRVALRAATGRSDIEDVDILPFAEVLPGHAYADAEEAGHANPANAADRVRRFLAIVEGREYKRTRGGERYINDEWRPLYQVARSLGNRYEQQIASLYRVATARKPDGSSPILDPADLPDQTTIRRWLSDAGLKRRYVSQVIRAYQLSRSALPAEERQHLPPLDMYQSPEERGLRALPHLEQLLDDIAADRLAKGEEVERVSVQQFREMPSMERIRIISEGVHFGLTAYLDKNQHLSGGWKKAAILGVERTLAAMEIAGYSIIEHDPMDLYTKTATVAKSGSTNRVNPLLERRYGAAGVIDSGEAHYLLRKVADAAARMSFKASPLELVRSSHTGSVPYYTATVERDLQHFYQMCRVAYEEVKHIDPVEWTAMEVVHGQLKAHMKQHNAVNHVRGQKNKEAILDIITLPQIICIGLPALRRRVRRIRERYHAAICDHSDLGHPQVNRARMRYKRVLRDYLITAVMISDGLRVKNYTGARLGAHFLPEPIRDETGRWIGLEGVRTTWRGFDSESVRLKIMRDELGAERTRTWHLLPGIVDLELLWEYLVDFRVDDLVSAGLIPSAAVYDIERDVREWQFALFTSGHPASKVRDGCFHSPEFVSTRFGHMLHWMATEVLGHELPRWGSAELAQEYRALFSGHITRLLLATYWGGIRSAWTRATMLTDDTEETLRRSYSKVGARLIERFAKDDWTNPHFFDEEMDRIFRDEVIDWDSQPSGNWAHTPAGHRQRSGSSGNQSMNTAA